MDRAVRGLLGGLGGLGEGVADVAKEQSKYRYDELKAKTLFEQQKHIVSLQDQSAKERAQMQIAASKEASVAAEQMDIRKEGRAFEAAKGLDEYKKTKTMEELAEDAELYVGSLPSAADATPEQLEKAKKDFITYQKLQKYKTDGKLGAEVDKAIVEVVSKDWESMDEDDRKAYGKDPIAAKANYIANASKGWRSALRPNTGMPDFLKVTPTTEKLVSDVVAKYETLSSGDQKALLKQLEVQRPDVYEGVLAAVGATGEEPKRTLRPSIRKAGEEAVGIGKKIAVASPVGLLYKGSEAALDYVFPKQ